MSRHGPLHRRHASTHDGHEAYTAQQSNASAALPWPKTANPTPYEILGVPRHRPYDKKRYYELVKLYHPDRYRYSPPATGDATSATSATSASDKSTLHPSSLPAAVRLERYRLIVAANALLSDAKRRAAYDRFGIGWSTAHGATSASHAAEAAARDYNDWHSSPTSAARNATWEDWAAWYAEQQRRAHASTGDSDADGPHYWTPNVGPDGTWSTHDGGRRRQQPVYMSNGAFVAVLLAFAVVGGVSQATRAEARAAGQLALSNARNAQIGEDMQRRQMETEKLSRHDRVQRFLGLRESAGRG